MERFTTLSLLAVFASGFSSGAGAGSLTTLHQFAGGTDGAYPATEFLSAGGLIYGTTNGGRKIGSPTVFSVDPATGNEAQIYLFPGKTTFPYGELGYKKSLLYSETQNDIISIDPSTGREKSVAPINEGEGLFAGNGVLYGTTTATGPAGAGTIFAFDPKTKTVTALYSFLGPSQNDGQYPVRGLTIDKHTLYGATGGGGTYQLGTVFSFDVKTQAETVLYSFAGGEDGAYPLSQPLLINGLLYGTTADGISGTPGTLYSIDPATGVKTVLYSFVGGLNASILYGQLCYNAGLLYGVSASGGAYNYGAIYTVDIATGAEQVVYSFQSTDGNGHQPEAGLVYVNDAFYGTTRMGDGKTYYGTVFRFTP